MANKQNLPLHISLFRSVKLLRISIFPRITFFDLSLVTITQNVGLCRGQVFTACVRSILCSLYIQTTQKHNFYTVAPFMAVLQGGLFHCCGVRRCVQLFSSCWMNQYIYTVWVSPAKSCFPYRAMHIHYKAYTPGKAQ